MTGILRDRADEKEKRICSGMFGQFLRVESYRTKPGRPETFLLVRRLVKHGKQGQHLPGEKKMNARDEWDEWLEDQHGPPDEEEGAWLDEDAWLDNQFRLEEQGKAEWRGE